MGAGVRCRDILSDPHTSHHEETHTGALKQKHFHGLHSKRIRRTSWLLTFYSIPEFLFLDKWITNISTAWYILESSFRKRKVKLLCCVKLFETPRTVACQAPPSMWFSRQQYWSGCHVLLQGILPTQELNPGLPHCRQTLWSEPPGKPRKFFHISLNWFPKNSEISSAGVVWFPLYRCKNRSSWWGRILPKQ